MERVISAALLVAESLDPLRLCGSCQQPLHPLFCRTCRRGFCRCQVAIHAACERYGDDGRVSRVLHAFNSICDWASYSRLHPVNELPSPGCVLKLRIRSRPPRLRLKLRLRPPREPNPSASRIHFPHPSAIGHSVQTQSHLAVPDTNSEQHQRPQAKSSELQTPSSQQSSVSARVRIRGPHPPRRTKRQRVPSRRILRTDSVHNTTPAPSQRQIEVTQRPSAPSSSDANARDIYEKPISQQTTQPPSEPAPNCFPAISNALSQTRAEQKCRQDKSSHPDTVQKVDMQPLPELQKKQIDLQEQSGFQRARENTVHDARDSTQDLIQKEFEGKEQTPQRTSKRLRSNRKRSEGREITPPLKKRRYAHAISSGTIDKVSRSCTRSTVSKQISPPERHENPSDNDLGPVEQPAPKAKVTSVHVEQPFASSSIDSKDNMIMCAAQGGVPGLDDSCHSAESIGELSNDKGKIETPKKNAQPLRKADDFKQNIGNTLQPREARDNERHLSQRPSPDVKSQQVADNGDAAEDKLSEGTTNPSGREDGYQDDPITPTRDGFNGRRLEGASKCQEDDTAANVSLEKPASSAWNSRSSRPFISPLTVEKPKKAHSPSTDYAPSATKTKSVDKTQTRIASGALAVCLCGFRHEEQYDLVFEIITLMGGEPVEQISETPPHCLLTPLDPATGAIKSREMAINLALAFRVPIVGMQWLLQSFKAGRWLSPEEFDASSSYHTGDDGIFCGVIATIDELFLEPDIPDKVAQFREDVKRVITGADGVVVESQELVERVRGSPTFTLHVHVVKGSGEEPYDGALELPPGKFEALQHMQDKIPTKVVNMKWLSECLFSGQCPPPECPKTNLQSKLSPTQSS